MKKTDSKHIPSWSPSSWRTKECAQKISYPDKNKLQNVEKTLSSFPPLIFAGEARLLQMRLAQASRGEAFLLQGGDCAESFSDFSANTIRDNFRILLQMAIILTFKEKRTVIKVGRMAGQFAKPRSQDEETKDGSTLPSYRGDIINGHEFNKESRTPDPSRMTRAYIQAASTLNLLRALAYGGYADLHQLHLWNLDFVKKSSQSQKYENVAQRLDETLSFMSAIGINSSNNQHISQVEFYTSHEALLLNYEESLTRRDSTTQDLTKNYEGDWYCCSAHMLWLGERTRQIDGAHVEFLSGINNPIGIKCGPKMSEEELMLLLDKLNPHNEEGRITLISRMGDEGIHKSLSPLIRRVQKEGRKVLWCCDPMHGNTITSPSGQKTRPFERILREVKNFYHIHEVEGTYAGGVHFELTGKDVEECIGGDQNIGHENLLGELYETLCDPRLNATQALELAFQLCHP